MPTAWALPAPTRPLDNTPKIWADQQQPDGSLLTVGLNPADVAQAAGALIKSGGTLTGPLVLAADPLVALQAATKQYVDNHGVTAIAGPALFGNSGTVTAAPGAIAIGVNLTLTPTGTLAAVVPLTGVCGLTGSPTVAQLLTAIINALPTTPPVTAGVPWLNSGVFSVSQ
jgi:hypothetical protein